MKDPQNSIMDCAFESGFSSVRTFYRAFAAEFGCSPKEYRK
ncbi:MAG: helix-turn-helix transcriptional regulator, partial [Clostridia bacterium]|nr:helix-turn-helix transcriptional regulator [Clostridia bacterium]